MFTPLSQEEIFELLEGHEPVFDKAKAVFPKIFCPKCNNSTIPQINSTHPFKGDAINYLAKCTQCEALVDPNTLQTV